VETAVAAVLAEGKVRTPDLGGKPPARKKWPKPCWRNWLSGTNPASGTFRRHAFLVGPGILLSRLVGLVRQYVFNRTISGCALTPPTPFHQAFRIPNFLQNLFGEGVLSASFIPIYARLLAEGDEEESGRVAGAVAAILGLTAPHRGGAAGGAGGAHT
jgi:hypothetical protein